jgi:hypothetical protein
MADEGTSTTQPGSKQATKPGRFLGSLKEALAAAGREETHRTPKTKTAPPTTAVAKEPISLPKTESNAEQARKAENAPPASPSAAEAAAAVKGQTSLKPQEKAPEPVPVPFGARADEPATEPARTKLVRGKVQVKRGSFEQDPVVGWLVVVGGPGIGSYRPVFEGNNTLGRARTQRIPLDFGDDTISSEEQAYIRYDSAARSFLFVPNLTKTNIVSVNDKRPTGAVELNHMDVITVGRTQLVFVPFCGAEFDWAELTDAKS